MKDLGSYETSAEDLATKRSSHADSAHFQVVQALASGGNGLIDVFV
jgi:hypothetical protein